VSNLRSGGEYGWRSKREGGRQGSCSSRYEAGPKKGRIRGRAKGGKKRDARKKERKAGGGERKKPKRVSVGWSRRPASLIGKDR